MPGLLLVTPPGPEAEALSAVFRARGYEVHQAGNGSAAVDLANRRHPDVILLDPALSAMDRWHAVKRLNTDPSTMRIPVLTLLSEGDPTDLERALVRIEEAVGAGRPPRPSSRTPVPPRTPVPAAAIAPAKPPGGWTPTRAPSRAPLAAPAVPARSAARSPVPPSREVRDGPSSVPPASVPVAAAAPPAGPWPPPATSAPAAPPVASHPSSAPPATTPSSAPSNPLGPPSPPQSAPATGPTAVPAPALASLSRAPASVTANPGAPRVVPTPPPALAEGDTSSDEARAPVSASILVVDDNAMNRDMLSRRLERRGYTVAVAEDGEAALRLLTERTFDAVILDWMMPGLTGIDVLREVRRRWSPIELPVIMATAKSEAEDVLEALRADANDYVTKPLNFEVVHARLRTHLNLLEAHRSLLDAHRALRASEQRYRALLENTGDMIVQFGLDGTVTYVSPAVRTLLGVSPEQFSARRFTDWFHPIDRRALEERRVLSTPSATFVARLERSDGSHIWVETSCRRLEAEQSPEGEASDSVPVVQAACRDVSEHLDRVTGDEPPLPLGGDLLARPAWRLGAGAAPEARGPDRAAHAATSPAVTPGPPPPPQIVVIFGEPSGSPDEIGRRVAEAVAQARGER